MAELKIRQYTYFSIRSRDLSADEIERRLGISPDRVVVAGSESQEPTRPSSHSWELISSKTGLGVDEQIAEVINRLGPAREAIKNLIATADAVAVLQVVRHFDDDEGESETRSGPSLEKLSGQHQLLGWHLNRDTMAFLVDIGADLDVDEYG